MHFTKELRNLRCLILLEREEHDTSDLSLRKVGKLSQLGTWDTCLFVKERGGYFSGWLLPSLCPKPTLGSHGWASRSLK